MNRPLAFDNAARIAEPGDNVAIAIRHLPPGTSIDFQGSTLHLPHGVLEGHRFAVEPIAPQQPLISWGLPFGLALTPIQPGDYVCNETMLAALHIRQIAFPLPGQPNFKNHSASHGFNPATFKAGTQVPLHRHPQHFQGFLRPGQRGTGTRNFIAILGLTSQTAAYARSLAARFTGVHHHHPNLDGVVAIAHTEGGTHSTPNNLEFLLRTLAGFIVHPNIAAILIADIDGHFNNRTLKEFMAAHGRNTPAVPHQFITLSNGFQNSLDRGAAIINSWLAEAGQCQRTSQPLSQLKIALQCGGSDAFSGVSGNPLAGWIAKELLRHGGSANLGETSELMGAEPYILRNVRDLETARKFLGQIERFEQWANWHGHSAEGNPSGGNLYRGLYNITIKSIGAARKKDPEVRLDYAIDYSEPMTHPGYYFMDSPGNDLECIAGQAAAGCNLILFITGNGSITNFPFVPTLKIVTTTGRYNLLRHEMDINAGRYLDGMPMEELARESFQLTLETASGKRSAGEQAGHSQVQLWRDWRQTSASQLPAIQARPRPGGNPIPVQPGGPSFPVPPFTKYHTETTTAAARIGLIVPTSLCSGQIARLIADQLNLAPPPGIDRFVALVHTEGCGVARGESENLFMRTLAGYLCHPFVHRALLLEHGCEKTHNDEMTRFLRELDIDPGRFGQASVQMDGGIGKVSARVIDWFQRSLEPTSASRLPASARDLRIGLLSQPNPDHALAQALGSIAHLVAAAGGTAVLPDDPALTESAPFLAAARPATSLHPTLDYGQRAIQPGLHVMDAPTRHDGEIIAGLGATGVELILAGITSHPLPAHPMVPVLQISSDPTHQDADLVLDDHPAAALTALMALIARTTDGRHLPKLMALGNTDFQITRGLVGVSL